MTLIRMCITGVTATGDVITGPGAATCLVGALPASCMGDAVTGAACVGVVSACPESTVMALGRPIATMTSTVTGTNPATGVPVTTTCLSCSNVKVM